MAQTFDLISSSTLTAATNSVTFSSIPATYTDLLISLHLKSTYESAATTEYRMRMNGDTSTNYGSITFRVNNTPALNFTGKNTASGDTWTSLNYSGDADETFGCGGWVVIHSYNNTNFYKNYLTHTGNATGVEGNGLVSGFWKSLSAITSLTIYAQRDNFAIGSKLSLYGIKAA